MDTSIFMLKKYGKVKINIKDIMQKKKITRNKLAKLTGTTYNVIKRYYNAQLYKIDLDVIARICYALNCEIADILEYEREDEH